MARKQVTCSPTVGNFHFGDSTRHRDAAPQVASSATQTGQRVECCSPTSCKTVEPSPHGTGQEDLQDHSSHHVRQPSPSTKKPNVSSKQQRQPYTIVTPWIRWLRRRKDCETSTLPRSPAEKHITCHHAVKASITSLPPDSDLFPASGQHLVNAVTGTKLSNHEQNRQN